jgi:diguanylate cyclase (GGDEF)-like protein/PAS domain S-box-containing protein
MKKAFWHAIIEGTLEAVWLIDVLELKVIAANHTAEAMLGASNGGCLGMSVIELAATPEDMYFWEDVAAGLAHQIRSETLLKRLDGQTLPVERSVTRAAVGDEAVYILAVRDLSEQRRVETELETLVAELRATLESTADGIMVVDLHEAIRSYNQRFAEMWTLPDELLTERNDKAVFAWMEQCVVNVGDYSSRLSVIARSPLLEGDDIIVLRSGRMLERHTLPQYARGRPIGRVFSFRDITQRVASEAKLQLAAKVFENSLDAIFVTDPDFKVVSANPSCERLTGIARDAMDGYALGELIHDSENRNFAAHMVERLNSDGHWGGEVWHRAAEGRNSPYLVSMVRVSDEQGAVSHYIGFFKDLSETLAAKQRIEELAYNDVLTGLPNRLLLAERIQFSLSLGKRDGTSFAILFLDLDHFKHVNDSLGHQFGDKVLIEVAHRIKGCLRQADTAARLGGDEFVLLLHDSDAHGAEITARRVLDTLCMPFNFDEINFNVTCSIGIALFPDDGESMDDLVKNADSAMYHVKDRGRSDFHFYRPQMNIDLLARMKLDHAMRIALQRDAFRLAYQPQIDLASGRIYGAEALLRWHDEALGEVSPGYFIPVAEETGVIVHIGQWVLREAVRQAALWHRQGHPIDIAVNVSALQFRQLDFIENVAAVLAEFNLPAKALELELTESILIKDADDVLRRLQALAALGIKLSIDDFGTGYSSLSYLKRFPLHRLKIDRSFITHLPADDSDAAIVTAIINMARALNLRVIAEGVETEQQREFLATAGCHEYQGYLCAPALAPLKLIEKLKA